MLAFELENEDEDFENSGKHHSGMNNDKEEDDKEYVGLSRKNL